MQEAARAGICLGPIVNSLYGKHPRVGTSNYETQREKGGREVGRVYTYVHQVINVERSLTCVRKDRGLITSALARGARGCATPPAGAPRGLPEGEKIGHMCVKLLKIRVSFVRLAKNRNKHRLNLLHITTWMSARRSTLRNLRNVQTNSFDHLPPQLS